MDAPGVVGDVPEELRIAYGVFRRKRRAEDRLPPTVLIALSSTDPAFGLDAGLSRPLQPGDARLGSFLVPGNGVLAFFDRGAGGV